MKSKVISIFGVLFLVWLRPVAAQNLGQHFVKLKDGIYVYARNANSNCGIIVTQEGVVLIDSGPNPPTLSSS